METMSLNRTACAVASGKEIVVEKACKFFNLERQRSHIIFLNARDCGRQ
jgi:hypothetical protein